MNTVSDEWTVDLLHFHAMLITFCAQWPAAVFTLAAVSTLAAVFREAGYFSLQTSS